MVAVILAVTLVTAIKIQNYFINFLQVFFTHFQILGFHDIDCEDSCPL